MNFTDIVLQIDVQSSEYILSVFSCYWKNYYNIKWTCTFTFHNLTLVCLGGWGSSENLYTNDALRKAGHIMAMLNHVWNPFLSKNNLLISWSDDQLYNFLKLKVKVKVQSLFSVKSYMIKVGKKYYVLLLFPKIR